MGANNIDLEDKETDNCNAVHYSYQYRLYPTTEQRKLLSQHCGAVRFVYNHFLARRQDDYLNSKKTSNYYADQAALAELKKSGQYDWMYEVNSQSLQFALRNLSIAYLKFFRGEAKFPRFHSKKEGRDCFRILQNVKLVEDKLLIPKFKEGIRVKVDRPCLGKICFANIRKTKTNKYFVSITCEVSKADLMKIKKIDVLPHDGKAVGIDLGIKDFAITSDGLRFKNLKLAKQCRRDLNYLHRQLSKKAKDSKRRERARLRLARKYEKISNARKNHIHNITTRLVRENQTLAIENLAVVNMMKNHKLAGAIADCSWGEFVRQLQYKCKWYGRSLVVIDRFFPSSKMCHECGYINYGLTLKDRHWDCPRCGEHLDRDVNAARNILRRGQIILSGSGTESDVKQKPEEAFSVRFDHRSKPMQREVNDSGNPCRL